MPLTRRAQAAVMVAVLASGLAVAGQQANADEAGTACTAGSSAASLADGPSLRYLVLFSRDTSPQSAQAQIAAACGRTTVFYPQIAVAVATSADPGFGRRMGQDRAFSAEAQRLADGDDDRRTARRSDETFSGRQRPATPNTARGAVPTADRTGEQWDMVMIGADRARQVNRGSGKVVVGVLDSGVDATHPDLSRAVDADDSAGCLTGAPDTRPTAWAPTTSAHGTHVAGTIAAADDGRGITGVAPGVRVASVKVVDDDGYIYPEYAVCGFMWAAARGMRVTNSSFVVDPWLFTCSHGAQRVVRESLRRAVEYATARGVVNVAAATNEGVDMANPPQPRCQVLPAGLRGVVAVSAVGPDRLKAGYSAYGLGVIDVTAPGGERRAGRDPADGCVLSTVPGGYGRYCGTSMAAPHVAGVVALLASTRPGASAAQLTRQLNNEAKPVGCPDDYDLSGTGVQDAFCTGYEPYNSFYGHGMVDALAAVTG